MNDGTIKSGEREKGFFSIGGALRYFGEDEIDIAHKKDMRDRIVQGPPFSHQEQRDILDYCDRRRARTDASGAAHHPDDPLARACAVPHQVRHGRSRNRNIVACRSTFRCSIASATAGMACAPISSAEMDRPFGIYEFEDGKPHWRKERFAAYVRHNRMSWPTFRDGTLDETRSDVP